MKILNIIRSHEWWAYKLPPLLAIAYATTLMSSTPLYKVALWFVFLLSSLIIGAVYVSVINDITDLDEDLASGKSNRIQQVPVQFRWFIPILCISIGFVFGYFIYPDVLSCSLYFCSWVVFSLYSIKPIRLKARGIFGVFADCSGSHLFPSLLMVSSVSYYTNTAINFTWFSLIGIWAFCYGLRGILWHQFSDRENDIKVKLNTYASKIEPLRFKNQTIIIITLELLALCGLLYKISIIAVFIALIFYIILVFIRYKWFASQLIIIIKHKPGNYQILMADYYQVFLPVSLLVASSLSNYYNLFILIAHIILFPNAIIEAIANYITLAKILFAKIFYRVKNN